MKTIAFYDTKPYEREAFENCRGRERFTIRYFESRLNEDSAAMAVGCDAVCAFVNSDINSRVIDQLVSKGVEILALRCAGYNNVDLQYARGRLTVVRVPGYSPYAVAEHAMALLQTLNRKIHKAYLRTRDHNFSLDRLLGFDLHGRTMGLVGAGRIGRVMSDICRGYGMEVLAYDPHPAKDAGMEFVSLEELCQRSHVISLHCPLVESTYHIIDEERIAGMRQGVILINTSRGALIDSQALVQGLKSGTIGGACLDVYEEEETLFFEDYSDTIVQDDLLVTLISMPNVLVTGHQAFLTREALSDIAQVTLTNLEDYFDGRTLTNEIVYQDHR